MHPLCEALPLPYVLVQVTRVSALIGIPLSSLAAELLFCSAAGSPAAVPQDFCTSLQLHHDGTI